MPSSVITLIIVAGSMFALFIIISTVGNHYSLNRIKNKTVGQGQYGTARWATKKEVKKTYKRIDFQPNEWRNNPDSRPTEQGMVVGCKNSRKGTTAMVDTGDVHALMIGAAGVSAVPMAARVVHKIGLEEDKSNYLLMHAMGPNVDGVFGSAVAAGLLLSIFG